MEKIMENLPSYLFYFCIFFLPAILTLVITLKATGWKRLLSWGHFALLVLPLAIAGGGGMILSAQGLSWRSCVKLPCGFAYVAGVTLLLLQAAAFLWRKIAWWRPMARGFGRCAIFAAGAFLCLTLTWYGLIFPAIWAGRARVETFKGRPAVAEQTWTDWDVYAYHSPLIRGAARLGGYN